MSTHAGNSRLKPALIMGFGAILAILSVVAGTALHHTQVAEDQLTEVATEVRETHMVFDIRDAVNQQGLALIRSVNASSAIELRDAELVRLTAHTLKGLGGNFGHPRITELAKEVEMFAKNGGLESAQAATAKLTEYYDSTKKTA